MLAHLLLGAAAAAAEGDGVGDDEVGRGVDQEQGPHLQLLAPGLLAGALDHALAAPTAARRRSAAAAGGTGPLQQADRQPVLRHGTDVHGRAAVRRDERGLTES